MNKLLVVVLYKLGFALQTVAFAVTMVYLAHKIMLYKASQSII